MKESAPTLYFAGSFRCEDDVSGGTGATIDDAVNDYFSHHANDECDYYLDEIDGSELVVTVVANQVRTIETVSTFATFPPNNCQPTVLLSCND